MGRYADTQIRRKEADTEVNRPHPWEKVDIQLNPQELSGRMSGWMTFMVLLVACAHVRATYCPCEFDDDYGTWDCSKLELTKVPTSCWTKSVYAYRVFLYQNNLTKIEDGAFNGLAYLSYLFLYSNQISSMGEKSLEGLEELTYLDLSYNDLQTLPPTLFDNLGNLNYLFIYNNSLQGFPSLEGLASLNTLYIHNNRLTSLPIMPTSSEPIDLSFYGNSITTVPAVAVLPLQDHSVLRMDRGTIICCQSESERIKVLNKLWMMRDQDNNGLSLNHVAIVC